jgi:hypothetical protein
MNLTFLLIVLSLALFDISKSNLTQSHTKVKFLKLSEFNNFEFDKSYLLISFDSSSKTYCLASCVKYTECAYTIIQKSKCLLCKANLTNFMNFKSDAVSSIYQKKFQNTRGLINYWAFNGDVNDALGNAHLYGGVNAALTFDRFGVPNSALSLRNGYYKVPAGVYFSGNQLTIMAWVKIRNIQSWSRLIDFGIPNSVANNPPLEAVFLSLSFSNTGNPYLRYQSGSSNFFEDKSLKSVDLNQWKHIACIFSYPYYSIYIDGVETTTSGSKTSLAWLMLTNITRTSNFIGRSNWIFNGDKDADADFDDLKIFDRALSQKEITFEMNNNL